jgi:hypothetical protein
MSSLLNALDGQSSSQLSSSDRRSFSSQHQPARARSSLVRIKAEDPDDAPLTPPSVPMKRASDEFQALNPASENLNHVAKRPKLPDAAPIPKRPLGPTNSYEFIPAPSPAEVAAIREEISNLLAKMSVYQRYIQTAERKRDPTRSDMTRLATYKREYEALAARKAQKQAQLPTMQHYLPPPPQPLPFHLPKPEPTPARLPDIFDGPGPSTQAIAKREPPTTQNRVDLRDHDFFGVGMPGAWMDDSEDEFAELEDGQSAAMAVAQQFVGSAIPYIGALTDDRDENGDWFGRGRDTFQGPVARADE